MSISMGMFSLIYIFLPSPYLTPPQHPNATVVERVVKGGQGEVSEIRGGDVLIAVDQFNVSVAVAKSSTRLLEQMAWPKTLVFRSGYLGEDPRSAEASARGRYFNGTLLYPPVLWGGDFMVRVAY
ncbi:hypothetical protein EON65_58845 [archaeon]|nr:MAG: hypothetical protein EON65_58845 [archaeon]